MEKKTTNQNETSCISCGCTLLSGEGRGVNETTVHESQHNYLCCECWDTIGKHSYSEYA